MKRITDRINDIKAEDPFIRKPLSLLYKYIYIASLLTFALTVMYGGYKVVYTIASSPGYKRCINDAKNYKEEVDRIDANIAETGKLYTFFDQQQKWLNANYSSSKVWSDVFQAIPSYISLDSAKLEFSEAFSSIHVTYIKLRRSSPNPIAEFSKDMEQLGYRFTLKREGATKKGQYFFQGKLENKPKEAINGDEKA